MKGAYTGRTWRLEVGPHVKLLTANDALTVKERIRRQTELRDLGYYLALSRRIPKLQFGHVLYYLLVTETAKTRDPANWQPTAKHLLDGIVKAGVFPDDDYRHVLGPDPRLVPGASRRAFLLVVSELAFMPAPFIGE